VVRASASGAAYEYAKSLYAQDWCDSGTERDLANLLDNGDDIEWWMRLRQGDSEDDRPG
jgi:hypothetical protein